MADLAQAITRGSLSVLVVVVAIDVLHTGDAGVGVLTAAVGAARWSARWRSRCSPAAVASPPCSASASLWGLPLVVAGAVPVRGVVLAMLATVGVGNALVDVGIFTLPPRLVPDAVLACRSGALESLGTLASPAPAS